MPRRPGSVEELSVRLNVPIPQAQPEQLATIAHMRGMQPCPAAQAAVLEIGCGSGSNLLPLAERYPAARLLGIDVLPDKVAEAQQLAAHAGLTNAEFRCVPLEQFAESPETFDYILAMDVYSWLDERSRDALLANCQRHLAPQGVVYLNYNVNPGWQFHEMLGAMMRFEARAPRPSPNNWPPAGNCSNSSARRC